MPNIKSQKDRVNQTKIETLRNKAVKSNLKTVVKKADAAIAAGANNSDATVIAAVSATQKAASKGIMKKNAAARKVSHIMKKANG